MKIDLNEGQAAAIDVMERNKMCVFTGPPGSGKTTTLAQWLSTQNLSKTMCMAPTGRAAQRMMESFSEAGVKLGARTIHASLVPDRNGHDGNGWSFKYNRDEKLQANRIIIDETSMCDNSLMASVLEAIPPGAQVILVGDPDQLPPVGKGRPFLDMINSGSIPHAKLTEIHRFAGRIAHVCQKINRGQSFETSPSVDMGVKAGPHGPENLRHLERKNGIESFKTMKTLVQKIQDRGFDPIHDMQVIVTLNDTGIVPRSSANRILQELLNPNGKRISDCPFRVGDKVMCLKNGTRKTENAEGWGDLPAEDGSATYVANGESGLVEFVDKKAIWVRFSGQRIRFTRAMWNSQVTLAYAITVHKSQGGGWPVVIFLIDDATISDRSLTYTAISRSKKLCFTIGRMDLINKHIREIKVKGRKTFLKEMLQDSDLESI